MTTALKLAARGVLMACGALEMVGAPDQAEAIVGILSALLIASAAS